MRDDHFQAASFGDARLDRRFALLRESALKMPSESFPRMAGSEAGREATYRFLNNRRVTFAGMLAPHIESSLEYLRRETVGLVIHDSTEFKFTGDSQRPGLGRMAVGQGFLGHFALGVTADGRRTPVGVVGISTIFRDEPPLKQRATPRPRSERESLRWQQLVADVEDRAKHPALVHVMDREADSYEMLDFLQRRNSRFVVRLNRERFIRGVDDDEWVTTDEHMASTRAVLTRTVALSRRTANRPLGPRRKHPPREGREATLCIGAERVVVRRPGKTSAKLPPTLTLNVVRVWEENPPAEEQRIEWMLLTSEPIGTIADLERIVDWYRARWVIEEYFKALKTGCSYEGRQLENRQALLNALGLFVPIAWQMLALRTEARNAATSTSTVVNQTQVAILRALLPRKIGPRPTARDLYLAIAEIGGHIKNNGEPGWLVLTRGFTSLRDHEVIWKLAVAAQKM